jgi:MFS family permease
MESSQEKTKVQNWPTIEISAFLLFFGWYLTQSIVTNQILKQTCLYTYEYGDEICSHLDDKNSTALVEQEIQPFVAKILMTISILKMIPTALSLFYGPWSDKFGRKKILNGIFIGFTISIAWITIVSWLSDFVQTNSPWNYLYAQIPSMIAGSWPTLIIVIICYITDKTTEEKRSLRMTTFEITIFIGMLISLGTSSFILEITNPTIMFSISFVCISTGTFIMIFFVDESVKMTEESCGIKDQFKELFSVERIKELYKTCGQLRPKKTRRTLICLGIILICINFTNVGPQTVRI